MPPALPILWKLDDDDRSAFDRLTTACDESTTPYNDGKPVLFAGALNGEPVAIVALFKGEDETQATPATVEPVAVLLTPRMREFLTDCHGLAFEARA